MTDNEREVIWSGLVASMPGETQEDRLLSLMLYTARELTPAGSKIDGINVRVTFMDRAPMEFPAKKIR